MAVASAQIRADLAAALAGPRGAGAGSSPVAAADRLCRACVGLLEVDGASVSVVHQGLNQGTFGSSGELSRRWDELQFTYGEGPCLEAVRSGGPVLVPDLDDPREQRWPAFRGMLLSSGVRAVFALPVVLASSVVGALDLFCHRPGPLAEDTFDGGLLAAELAALPLLDVMTANLDWGTAADGLDDGWGQLASLERVEVYQATGMIMEMLGVTSAEALVRIRAHAFAHGSTASEVAWAVLERRLVLDADHGRPSGGPDEAASDPW